MTDMTNSNLDVEMQAAAIAITDSLYHDADTGYLVKAIKDLAQAKKISRFDAAPFIAQLFGIRDKLKNSSPEGKQYSLVLNEPDDPGGDVNELPIQCPSAVIHGLNILGLSFKLEAKRPSLESLWDNEVSPVLARH